MKSYNYTIGRWGEKLTVEYLKKIGYKILDCNYRCKIGEIDIIAMDKDYIVFIEVKTRRNNIYPGGQAITKRKKERMKRLALFYLQKKKLNNANVRFDVALVENTNIDIIKNAFILYNN